MIEGLAPSLGIRITVNEVSNAAEIGIEVPLSVLIRVDEVTG
jgi:hypothetical protein